VRSVRAAVAGLVPRRQRVVAELPAAPLLVLLAPLVLVRTRAVPLTWNGRERAAPMLDRPAARL